MVSIDTNALSCLSPKALYAASQCSKAAVHYACTFRVLSIGPQAKHSKGNGADLLAKNLTLLLILFRPIFPLGVRVKHQCAIMR
jgi:hypothetical protein